MNYHDRNPIYIFRCTNIALLHALIAKDSEAREQTRSSNEESEPKEGINSFDLDSYRI